MDEVTRAGVVFNSDMPFRSRRQQMKALRHTIAELKDLPWVVIVPLTEETYKALGAPESAIRPTKPLGGYL